MSSEIDETIENSSNNTENIKGNNEGKKINHKVVRNPTGKKNEHGLNEREKQFVENYIFNGRIGTKAYMMAYDNDNYNSSAVKANKLLKKDKIQAEIARREQETKEHNLTHIASPDDILKFYTQVMINPDNKLDQRMKAGEYLGKSMGLFNDNQNQGNTTFQINLVSDEHNNKQVEFVQMPVKQLEYQEYTDDEYIDYEEVE